jgi:hypothetical protein
MRRTICVALACTMGLITSAEGRPRKAPAKVAAAPAPDLTESQVRFKRALELYEEGGLDAARVELRRAYDLAPNYRLLYNLGQVEFELHDYPAALADFQQFLTEGGAAVPPERRAQVEQDLEKLRARVATVDIVVDVANADVLVDDVSAGTSPLAKPLVVSAGRRSLVVTRSGFVPVKRVLEVAGGDKTRFDIHLSEIVAASPSIDSRSGAAPEPPPVVVSREAPSPGVPWFGWGLTAILAGGAATSGLLALDASHTLEQERGSLGVTRSTLDRQQKRVETLAIVADGMTGAAVIAASLSFYFTLARPAPREEGKASVKVAASPSGVSLVGAF